MLDGKTILITGGTGSFGNAFTRFVLDSFKVMKLIILSRDEFKQYEMARIYPERKYPIRFFLGDIRDKSRLERAFDGVDYVIHAAALKQVPALEYNPFEAVKTNILGAENIVDAALKRSVKKVIAVSTDKAVNPVNLYGGTKLVMEKIFIAANSYVGSKSTAFSVVRYGNVVGSRGSVIPYFMKLAREKKKEFPITDSGMTRFWITLNQGVSLVYRVLEEAIGGEIFVPRIPSMRILDLARAIVPDCTFRTIGIRPGEKLYETLISEDECRNALDMGDHYIILPQYHYGHQNYDHYRKTAHKSGLDETYRSDTNERWLSVEDIKSLIENIE
ncbi:MAG: UDP-N-acetylglucosamine 4,6-dehydratase (inverting) [bacterium]|nr:UDP-N-acetylglucosamine 4,6-dehydratase (inverting) [bacterium]